MDCARLFSHCSSHTVGAAFQRDFIFQPDTGPILCFPELNENVAPENLLGETAELAFVAWHTGGGELGPTATLDAAAEFLMPKGVPTGRPVSTLRAASMVMDSQAYLWPYTGSADAVAASHDAQFRNVLPVRATEPTAAEGFAPA